MRFQNVRFLRTKRLYIEVTMETLSTALRSFLTVAFGLETRFQNTVASTQPPPLPPVTAYRARSTVLGMPTSAGIRLSRPGTRRVFVLNCVLFFPSVAASRKRICRGVSKVRRGNPFAAGVGEGGPYVGRPPNVVFTRDDDDDDDVLI